MSAMAAVRVKQGLRMWLASKGPCKREDLSVISKPWCHIAHAYNSSTREVEPKGALGLADQPAQPAW